MYDVERTQKIENRSSDKSFGLIMAIFFAAVAILPMISGKPFRPVALAISAAFAVLAFLLPKSLRHLNYIWFKVGLLLHTVTSPLLMGAMFFLILTPIGLFRRLLSIDSLRLRLNPKIESYWVERTPPGPKPESMIDQF